MRKLLIPLLMAVLIFSVSAFAEPDAYGRALVEPKGDVVIENIKISKVKPLSSALAVYGLESNYVQGSTVMVTCDEQVKKACIGNWNPVLASEFYNAPKDKQTSSSYAAGARSPYLSLDAEDIGSWISYNAIYTLPANAKVGTWSLSCYLSCNSPAQIVGTVDEVNFEVGSSCLADNPKSRTLCYNGNPWYYDNCGKRTTQFDVCSANELCEGGACVPQCSGAKKNKVCDGKRLIWADECGKEVSLIEVCTSCKAGACEGGAGVCQSVPVKPCEGAKWSEYPVCEYDIVGCQKVCTLNTECPDGYVCLNGKCAGGPGLGSSGYEAYVVPGVLVVGGVAAGYFLTPYAFILAGVGVLWGIIAAV